MSDLAGSLSDIFAPIAEAFDSAGAALKEMDGQVSVMEQRIDTLRRQEMDLRDTVGKLHGQVEAQRSEMAMMQERADHTAAELHNQASLILGNAKVQAEDIRKEANKDAKARIDEASGELGELQAQVQAADSRLKRLRSAGDAAQRRLDQLKEIAGEFAKG